MGLFEEKLRSIWNARLLSQFSQEISEERIQSVLDGSYRQAVLTVGSRARFLREYERDALTRSMAQYLALQAFIDTSLYAFFYGVFVCLKSPVFILGCLLRSLIKSAPALHPQRLVFFQHAHIEARVRKWPEPDCLYLQRAGSSLNRQDLGLLLRTLAEVPALLTRPRFVYLYIKWLSQYSFITHNYRPRSVVSVLENNFCSSLITAYLHRQGIEHINCMHGEYYNRLPFAAFARFDRFLVPGDYWVEYFKKMRCEAQFEVDPDPVHLRFHKLRSAPRAGSASSLPRVLIAHTQLLDPGSPKFATLTRLLASMPQATPVKIRCHPNELPAGLAFARALERQFPERSFALSERGRNFFDDLSESDLVVGFTSAALMEAWIGGRSVVYLFKSGTLQERYRGSARIFFLEDTESSIEDCIERFIPNIELAPEDAQTIHRVSTEPH